LFGLWFIVNFKEKKMTKEEAVAKIADLVVEAYSAINEAESLADEHGLDFSFSPAYGMGGWYDGEDQCWNPSSQSC
jgi:hypothetical protein